MSAARYLTVFVWVFSMIIPAHSGLLDELKKTSMFVEQVNQATPINTNTSMSVSESVNAPVQVSQVPSAKLVVPPSLIKSKDFKLSKDGVLTTPNGQYSVKGSGDFSRPVGIGNNVISTATEWFIPVNYEGARTCSTASSALFVINKLTNAIAAVPNLLACGAITMRNGAANYIHATYQDRFQGYFRTFTVNPDGSYQLN